MTAADPKAPIAPEHKAPSNSTIYLKEKLGFTGDSASVLDSNGDVVFKIDAKTVTLSQRRYLIDTSSGKAIGQVRKKKTPGLHEACYVGTKSDDKRCMVKLKGALNPIKCDADIYLGDDVIGDVSGNWRAKSFTIRLGGERAATVSRKSSLLKKAANHAAKVSMKASILSKFLESDCYSIEVEEGFDMAFISLVAISLDELYHD